MLKGKRILVTGAAGFIGSHLTDRLLLLENKVTGIDNLSNGNMKNIADAMMNKNFNFIKTDISDKRKIQDLINKKFDYIFHLASGNLLMSVENPKVDINTSIIGTLNILESIVEKSSNTVMVYSSTGSVYGEPQYQPQDENHPLNPVSPYGIAKLAAEKYVLLWNKIYKVKSVALRYYNVYGPRQSWGNKGGVVNIFINNIRNGKSPVIEGSGNQERCFTFVDDVVNANILAAIDKKIYGEVFNIGTTEITTINQLAEEIMKIYRKKLKTKFAPRRIGDIDEFRPDINKAYKFLGYKPKFMLKEGLEKTIKWFADF